MYKCNFSLCYTISDFVLRYLAVLFKGGGIGAAGAAMAAPLFSSNMGHAL